MTAVNALAALGAGLAVCGLACLVLHRSRTGYGLLTLAYMALGASHLIEGDRTAVVDAGLAAGCAWAWWKHGGGDGTRRRLRRAARAFRGVRRTAPAAGAA